MFTIHGFGQSLRILMTATLLLPGVAAAEDRDTQEIQRYVLTDAALAKYKAAATRLAALPPSPSDCEDHGDDDESIAATVAKIDATPAVKAAITTSGMTSREYVVFTWSLLQNGLAAWALSQPGGKLPPGVSPANVDFYKRHAAELESLPKAKEADCGEETAEDEYTE